MSVDIDIDKYRLYKYMLEPKNSLYTHKCLSKKCLDIYKYTARQLQKNFQTQMSM